MNFDRKKFFDGYRQEFGSLRQEQVDGLEQLLEFIENDVAIKVLSWVAYMLATVKWETDSTFKPIREYGKGKGRKYGVPAANGHVYYGRGYVQITWLANYHTMSEYVGFDLVNDPDLALEPVVAYKIMSYGMRKGLFTGKKLSTYLVGDDRNYHDTRRIINGVDHADEIAIIAVKFERILTNAVQ